MQLFAYPQSRAVPWATAALLLAAGGVTGAAALYWNFRVLGAESLDELRERSRAFASALTGCSVGRDDLARGELHRLLLASLLRAGEQTSRTLADAAILVFCGTLLERLYGPAFVLGLVLSGAAVGNGVAAIAHSRALTSDGEPASEGARVASTSGGVAALGVFCILRHGRWAAWPGLPVPVAWLLAPMLVADLSAAGNYLVQLREYKSALAAASAVGSDASAGEPAAAAGVEEAEQAEQAEQADQGAATEVPSGLELAVSLAACEAVEDRARVECRPAPEDVVMWREDLEQVAEAQAAATAQPPDGAFLADAGGAVLALLFAVALRR